MGGFIIEHVNVDVSDTKQEKIKNTEDTCINGQKYKTAKANIEFVSTGDVSNIGSKQLLEALSDILPATVKIDNE